MDVKITVVDAVRRRGGGRERSGMGQGTGRHGSWSVGKVGVEFAGEESTIEGVEDGYRKDCIIGCLSDT